MPLLPEGVAIGFSQPPHPIPSQRLPAPLSVGTGAGRQGGGAGEGLV